MAIKVYIDQGHNPENPNAGAEGNGFREQDLVFAIGREFAEDLMSLGYEVRLSRPTPETQLGTSNITSLATRVNEANSWGADYFISLHANSSVLTEASGTEGLVYRLDSVAEELAEELVEGVSEATGLRDRGVTARPNLYVLRRTRMPAVLMELGFISNPDDARLMAQNPALFAAGLTNGFVRFLTDDAVAAVADVRSVQDTDDEQLSYGEFLARNPYEGTLKIQAFRGDQAYPVEGVKVRVFRQFSDGERTFFEGATDDNGIIDGIRLPAPSMEDSLVPNGVPNTAVYQVTATHPLYLPMALMVTIFEGIIAIQPLQLMIRGEN